jgi:RimJ/RimL family protein N-acetyltransferase
VRNPFLVGKRLYLRPLELDDAPTFVGWVNDPRVNRTLQLHGPMSEIAERDWIERTVRSKEGMAGVIMTRDHDRMIGVSGLGLINWRDRHASFGIMIGVPAMWGRGFGTEVTVLVTDYGFHWLNLNRVYLHVYAHNLAGIRAYEKAGYRLEGVQRQGAFREGAYHDVHLMAVLRDEWSRQGRTGSRANDAEPRRIRRSTGARRSVRSSTSTGRG